jgi:hypothetical protein
MTMKKISTTIMTHTERIIKAKDPTLLRDQTLNIHPLLIQMMATIDKVAYEERCH